MPKTCAKHVDFLRIQQRKTGGLLPTERIIIKAFAYLLRVKPAVLPNVVPIFPQAISPLFFHNLPLFEHIFYPVSTAPITTTTELKNKER